MFKNSCYLLLPKTIDFLLHLRGCARAYIGSLRGFLWFSCMAVCSDSKLEDFRIPSEGPTCIAVIVVLILSMYFITLVKVFHS